MPTNTAAKNYELKKQKAERQIAEILHKLQAETGSAVVKVVIDGKGEPVTIDVDRIDEAPWPPARFHVDISLLQHRRGWYG